MTSKIFVDSDVVISSLLSKKGAAYSLIYKTSTNKFISSKSFEELRRVSKELNIEDQELGRVIKKRFSKIELKDSLNKIKEEYNAYASDPNDSHIVAGAHAAQAKFIISYNQKDFKVDKIKEDFNIIVMKPAQFLQYLRSLK